MKQWWTKEGTSTVSKKLKAVAYYRHSAQVGQENSVEIQQENVRKFADKYGIEIVDEYADRGKSGLTTEGREQFKEMMKRVETDDRFQFVLCYDVSRWGRFRIPIYRPIMTPNVQTWEKRLSIRLTGW